MKRGKDFDLKAPQPEAKFPAAYFIELLFERQGELPTVNSLSEQITKQIGEVDWLFDSSQNAQNTQQLNIFYLKDHQATYDNGEKHPVGLTIGGYIDFDPASVTDFECAQCWNLPDVNALLSRCTSKVIIGDWMAAGMPYLERARLMGRWMELVVPLFPDLVALRVLPSGKILTVEELRHNPYTGEQKLLLGAINIRFFNIAGTNREYLVDSYGLYAFGLPDVQCHFHTLDPNEVLNLVFDVAAYLFQNGDIIHDGETVEGIDGERWRCQHEDALIQPTRIVLDISPGAYAAGERH